ncbi:MAG: TlpA disulfide reductase family protein [Rhodoferax sp.]|nr:TlpA disulfide reductase family protein [Rhodoferax sp.]
MTHRQTMPTSDSSATQPPSRRSLLLGAGVLAGFAGIGLAWWKNQGAAGGGSDPTSLVDGFWEQQWPTPQDSVLRMQDFRGKPLLINFWATWCPPCVAELPLLNDFYQRQKEQPQGWQVLGLAVDSATAVSRFLKKMPVDFPIGLAGASGSNLAKILGNPSGSLPFSVAVTARGQIAERKLGRLYSQDLDTWARLE